MSFQKNTVDFLKDYIIRYKKILLGMVIISAIIIGNKLYQQYTFWQFNKSLTKVIQQLPNNSYDYLNKFFSQYNSVIINSRSIFVLGFCYLKYIQLLLTTFKNNPKIIQLIYDGQWMEIKKNYSITDKEILKSLDNLEKIYQFTLKKIPYNCVLNSKDLNLFGENLNLLVFMHIIKREPVATIKNFYHKCGLHISLYCNYTKILYASVVNPRENQSLFIYNENNLGNLLKKIINF
jgi:hypothetical protein